MRVRIDPLDKLFSYFIRLRAENHCEYCGKFKDIRNLQCSHFHSRRKRSVRYDPDNACALDFSCHQYLGSNPYAHTEWFKKRLGSERFEQLNIRADTTYPKIDKDVIKASIKEWIKLLEEV